jgi:hypothetical protein
VKLKLILAVLALAGLASAFAIASPSQANGGHHGTGWTTTGAATGTSTGTSTGTTTGTTTGEHHRGNSSCQRVELRGTGSGSVALTVTKANEHGSSLVGSQVTLTIPTGATVGATACTDAAGSTLTLRSLVVKPPVVAPTTTTTTTSNTEKEPHRHGKSHH